MAAAIGPPFVPITLPLGLCVSKTSSVLIA